MSTKELKLKCIVSIPEELTINEIYDLCNNGNNGGNNDNHKQYLTLNDDYFMKYYDKKYFKEGIIEYDDDKWYR